MASGIPKKKASKIPQQPLSKIPKSAAAQAKEAQSTPAGGGGGKGKKSPATSSRIPKMAGGPSSRENSPMSSPHTSPKKQHSKLPQLATSSVRSPVLSARHADSTSAQPPAHHVEDGVLPGSPTRKHGSPTRSFGSPTRVLRSPKRKVVGATVLRDATNAQAPEWDSAESSNNNQASANRSADRTAAIAAVDSHAAKQSEAMEVDPESDPSQLKGLVAESPHFIDELSALSGNCGMNANGQSPLFVEDVPPFGAPPHVQAAGGHFVHSTPSAGQYYVQSTPVYSQAYPELDIPPDDITSEDTAGVRDAAGLVDVDDLPPPPDEMLAPPPGTTGDQVRRCVSTQVHPGSEVVTFSMRSCTKGAERSSQCRTGFETV